MNSSKETFLQVIDKHQGIITSLCKIYYPCQDDQRDAEQDIILQLWKSFDSFRGESEISTWIYKVSLNTILAKVRREQKRPQNVIINSSHENRIIAPAACDDDLQLLNQVIQSLKELDKAIVILYLEGYKSKETGELLGLSQSNITTRMSRIKKELKSKFSQYSHELR
ncbi:MAG: sigma-70 family RNA polymerase sigma factor [Cyclobacteriaceae bacterium]